MTTEIQLPVAELKAVLPGLSKVVSKRSSLPVLGCVRVERNTEGRVNITATDLDDYLTVQIKEPVPGMATAFLLPYEPLARAIKNASTKENIQLMDGGKKGLTLRTFIGNNPVDQKLEYFDIKEWPPIPVVKESGMTVDPELRRAIREAFACASTDESRLILNAAFLDVADPKAHYVVGTNGRVLFSANSFAFDLPKSLVLPNRKFLGWSGFWDEEVCLLSQEPGTDKLPGWVQYKTDKWTFVTRQIEGNYPNWKQIIPSGTAKTIIKLSQAALDELLSVIPKLPGKDELNSPVTLVAANNHLQIQGRNREDEKPASVPIDGTIIRGDNVSVGLNREFLVRALQFGLSEILVYDSLTPVVCQSEGKRLIIAPLNPGASPPETNQPNERTDMPKTTTSTAPPATAETPASESAIKSVMQQIEKIKDTLKGVLNDFNEVLANLKTVEKEKKATEKEIEAIRTTLRSLQKVQI